MTALVARHVDLAAVVALAGSRVTAPAVGTRDAVGRPGDGRPGGRRGRRQGVQLRLRRAPRAAARPPARDVVEFDPLTEALPAQTAALVLPGGFPEQHPGRAVGQRRTAHQIRELAPARTGATPSAAG